MPQAIGAYILAELALDTVLSATVFAAASAIVGSLVIEAGILALQSVLGGGGGMPKPADGKQAKRQPIPPRISGFGRSRIGGYAMCYEEADGDAYQVQALHDGLIDGFEIYYLNEDEVSLSGTIVNAGSDGRYGSSKVSIETRLGAATETAYSSVIAALGGVWTSDHRGDGIASLAIKCGKVAAEDYLKIYPNQLAQPSVLARLQLCWDPRDPAQTYNDDTTWTWTLNPALHLIRYITSANGMDQDVTTRILPEMDSWKVAADVCDEDVALAAGGTESRYEASGIYQHDNDPADVIGTLLGTFDGWMGETGTGALKVVAGKFYAPTFTVPPGHITGFRVQRFTPDEQAVNEIDFTFTSPAHRFAETQGQAWRDEDDISERGKTRTKSLSMTWVQSHPQCRRLLKREMHRQTSSAQGTIQTDLWGFRLLGERYVNINIPDLPSLGTFAVQINNASIDPAGKALSFDWVKVDATIDDWDPDTEEGTPPPDLDDVTSTGADSAISGSPTDLTAAGAVGHATITWRNPNSYNFSFATVFRGESTDPFTSATLISGPLTGALGAAMTYTDTHAAGAYRYWVLANTGFGEPSTPTGPASATIT